MEYILPRTVFMRKDNVRNLYGFTLNEKTLSGSKDLTVMVSCTGNIYNEQGRIQNYPFIGASTSHVAVFW